MKRLRIDAHNGAPVWGGAEIALARVIAGLHRRGHDVLLHCNDPVVERNAAALGAPTARTHLGGDIAVHQAATFALKLRRRKPDALLLGTFRKLWLGALAGRMAGVPRVVARIGLETDVPRSAKYRYVFARWVDAVAFNADVMRAAFAAKMPSYAGELVTIHTGIPRRFAESADAAEAGAAAGLELRRALGIADDAPVVGSVGRLATQKRYERLVDALRALPGAHGLIVGEGTERAALEARAREAGVADRLHLPGHYDDVGPALAAMDIFVLCSDREGMSNAMLEALAAGVPVVSTDVSGAREALASPPDGTDDPPGVVLDDPAALPGTLRVLLGDEARLRRMAGSARRVAGTRFDEERMLDDWERLLGGNR